MSTEVGSDEKIESAEPAEKKSQWDNDLPAGDSPPGPKWHLVASAVAWGVWVIFLLVMALERITSDPR